MYAQDYDDHIPMMDNNGSAYYGCCPSGNCLPDWGAVGSNAGETSAMFMGVVQPYLKNHQIQYCPEIGKTNWRAVIGQSWLDPSAYNATLDSNGVYADTYSQMAVNMLLTEFGPDASWTACPKASYIAPDGQLSAWTRPAELMLLTADSTWGEGVGGDLSPQNGVGNMAVWPAYGSQQSKCHNFGGYPGWTFYVHRASSRTGDPTANLNQGINSGRANVAFGDGHVKAVPPATLESCGYNTVANVWAYTYWDPRY